MPKVIFRPNPTPPPFVPPTPGYDAHYYAQSLNVEYDSEHPLELKFSPCSYPEFSYVEIYLGDGRVAISYVSNLPTESYVTFETEDSGFVPFQGRIEFYGTNEQSSSALLHSAPIDVSFDG